MLTIVLMGLRRYMISFQLGEWPGRKYTIECRMHGHINNCINGDTLSKHFQHFQQTRNLIMIKLVGLLPLQQI